MEHEKNLQSEYSSYFISSIDFPSQLRKGNGLAAKLRVAERVLYSREARQKIARLIADTNPDIAHVHGIAHETSPSILPAIQEAGIPVVQTLHDYKLLCPNTSFLSRGEVCERCRRHRYFNVVLRRCKRDSFTASLLAGVEMYLHKLLQIYERNVDLFLTPSEFLKNKLGEYGIKKAVIQLPNFVDVQKFQPRYESDGYLVYTGRLSREKGILTLLESMKHLGYAHLYVAGAGELEAPLREYAHQHGLSNVTFRGYLPTADLVQLVRGAICTIVPSEWYENYPMAVLESFACGTPVIGSNIGGIPELVKDGWNGMLFEPRDAGQLAGKIQSLLDDPERAAEMGRRGRLQVESVNSPERHYRRIVEIYSHLLEAKGKA
jgi:glycosyltransferase involved in cell wall biosynthesis